MYSALISRKENLVLTAIEVINELGIQGLSTREVAKRQGMSNAVLFSHFHSKNELISDVLDFYIKFDSAMAQTIISRKLNPFDSIRYVVETFVTYYENYPAITSIIQLMNGLLSEPELSEKVKSIYSERVEYLKSIIEDAQKQNQIISSENSQVIAEIIYSSFINICIKWRMDSYKFSLREQALATVDLILKLIKPK